MKPLPALLAGLLLVGAAGCGDDSGGGSTTTTTEAPTTTAAPATTTTPPASTTVPASTTTAPVDAGFPTDPEAYAVAFVEAWEVGDQARALELGTQDAVDTIFAYDSGGPGAWSLQQCEGAAGSSYCTFSGGGDPTVIVRVGNEAASLGQPQAVTEVQVESP